MIVLVKDLFRVLLSDSSSRKFSLAVIFGFAFSIAIILSTVGIMDGFEYSLRKNLKLFGGDFTVSSSNGFFDASKEIGPDLSSYGVTTYSAFVKTEGFLVSEGTSVGVLVIGIEPVSYNKVTGLDLNLKDNQLIIGSELKKKLALKTGESVSIAFAQTSKEVVGLPELFDFKVVSTVTHGLYQKDLRVAYTTLKTLQDILDLEKRVNLITARIETDTPFFQSPGKYSEEVEKASGDMAAILGHKYSVRPFWREFDYFIQAVKAEKVMISIVFQLIVVISIFNIVAFIIFLNERKIQEIFLFRALGMGQKKMTQMWYLLSCLIWIFSCLLSIGLVELFNYALQNFEIFKLPGDVYHLGSLSLEIDLFDYSIVFTSALIWMFLLSWFTMKRMAKKSLLTALRQEFS